MDTLCASSGQALLIWKTLKKKKNGATIEEAAAFAEDLRLHICHWVTVDDLVYLKRGGRTSPTIALVGKALGIKPLICVDNDVKLESFGKVRGRKKAITALADKYSENTAQPGSEVFITYSDCLEDAKELAAILKERHGAKAQLITDIGSVIGAHTGPGAIVFSFVGKQR